MCIERMSESRLFEKFSAYEEQKVERFGDNITESDNEEVFDDYFASEHICRVNVIREFRE